MRILVLALGLASLTWGCHGKSSGSSVSALDDAQCQTRLSLTGDSTPSHDFVFPDGIEQYTAGTRVLQLKTGRIYACKGFPYAAYCSAASNRFEPGTGSNWMAAWDLQ